jgi:hypothetical protein
MPARLTLQGLVEASTPSQGHDQERGEDGRADHIHLPVP